MTPKYKKIDALILLEKIPYQKPEIKIQNGMKFSEQILKEFGAGCHQCTSCHGCR